MTTPNEFQRAVDHLLVFMSNKLTEEMGKDLNIILTELTSLQKRVDVADERLRKAEIAIKQKDIVFMRQEYQKGWWILGSGELKPLQTFLEAIDSLPTPKKGD